jgi:capsular polysaccharide biosynthesis protein
MNLKTFLTAVRVYRKTFVVVTGTVLALGLTWLLLTPRYVSTTQLLVSIQGSTTAAAYQNDQVVAGRVNTYIALLTSDVVMKRVIDKLGLPLTTGELAAKVGATNVPPQTSVIDVAVTDEAPERAQRIADTLAGEFVSYADALETPTGEDGQKVHTTVVTAASEPHARIAERVVLGVLVALAALLLGAIAVWIRSLTDPVVRTAYRATAAAGVAVLGCVTSAAAASVGDLDGYRRLRTRLRTTTNRETANGRGSVSVLTSAGGQIDTAMIASNLGRAMEFAGCRSIVLDAGFPGGVEPVPDPAPPGIVQSNANGPVDQPDGNGNDWPEPEHRPDGFPDTLSVSRWAVEPDLIATNNAAGLIDRLRRDYEQVIIASPPVLSRVTASLLSDFADAVLLVIVMGSTQRRDLSRSAEVLHATGAPLIGSVLGGHANDDAGLPKQKSTTTLRGCDNVGSIGGAVDRHEIRPVKSRANRSRRVRK